MYRIISGLIGAAIYFGFQRYVAKRRIEDKKLYLEAAAFAVVTCVVMWMWRTYMGFEGMSTFGSTCPNGTVEVLDPVNGQQTTCVPNPNGRRTYPATTGFDAIPKAK